MADKVNFSPANVTLLNAALDMYETSLKRAMKAKGAIGGIAAVYQTEIGEVGYVRKLVNMLAK